MYTKKNLSNPIFFTIAVLLNVSLACGSNAAVQTQPASTGGQGQIEPTSHSQETYTLNPTQTPTPTEIPTATKPVVTNTPKPTINPELTSDKGAGIWLVGREVAVGLWRASGDCYAVTNDKNGNQLDMVDGAHSIISLPADAFTVEFVSFPGSCTWSYLDPSEIPIVTEL